VGVGSGSSNSSSEAGGAGDAWRDGVVRESAPAPGSETDPGSVRALRYAVP